MNWKKGVVEKAAALASKIEHMTIKTCVGCGKIFKDCRCIDELKKLRSKG